MSLAFLRVRALAVSRVSVAVDGTEADAASQNARFSLDGRHIVFESLATNIGATDRNGRTDLYARDSTTGEITRVSDNWRGEIAGGNSLNGRYGPANLLVFDSDALNLVPAGDTNAHRDVFVKNLVTGDTVLVSRSAAGLVGNNDSLNGQLSPDGTRVLFESFATNLVGADTNNARDLFLKDLGSGAISRVSAAQDGTQTNGQSANASFAPDGTKILFESNASNLIAGDSNAAYDIFLKDLATGAVTRVSTAADGTQANGHSFRASFTADGTHVLFESNASNLVPGDTNNARDIFLKNLATGAIVRVSEGANGHQLNGTSQNAMIAGNRVVFESSASNAVAGDSNIRRDVFLKDLETGALTRLSVGASGQSDGDSYNVRLSPDGRSFVFDSVATNLAEEDWNAARDVFAGRLEDAVRHGIVAESGGSAGGLLFFDSVERLPVESLVIIAPDGAYGTLSVPSIRDAAGTLPGEIDWSFLLADDLDWLAAGETLEQHFELRLTDIGGNSASETVTITITGENDAPAAVADALVFDVGQSIDDLAALLIANDTDPDLGDSLRIISIDAAELPGALAFDPELGLLTYALDDGSLDMLPWGSSVSGTLRYTVADSSGATSSADASITILGLYTGWPATRGDDVIVAGDAPATIYGLDGRDHITGSRFADVIDGGPGFDTLIGGLGDDIYVADGHGDQIVELLGEGYDTVLTALPSYRLPPHVEALVYNGPTRTFVGGGNSLNNSVTGGAGADRLYGWDGDDHVYGLAGNDTLEGNYGNDTLNGGPGRDSLKGGFGADIFVLVRGESDRDSILDFSAAEGDRLMLSGWSPQTTFTQSGSTLTFTDPANGFSERISINAQITAQDVFFG